MMVYPHHARLILVSSLILGACSSRQPAADNVDAAHDAASEGLANDGAGGAGGGDADSGADAGGSADARTEMEAAAGAAGSSGSLARCTALEPADAPALAELAAWSALPTLRRATYMQFSSTNRGAMPTLDANNYVCRGPQTADNGASAVFDTPTCAESYVKGYVAARVVGSGRLARFWLTGIVLGTELDGANAVLRIYVDDEPAPCIEVKVGDVKKASASLEIFAAPFGANTDNNLAWYYPVVFSRKLIVALDAPNNLLFHQTDVVIDEQPTTHVPSVARLSTRDQAKALLAGTAPLAPDAAPLLPATSTLLPTGTPVTIATLTGPATVTSFRVRVPTAALAALNQIDVSVAWEGASVPAIALSLGDLFATAQGMTAASGSSLALGITEAGGDTTLDLRLPMPFVTKAIVTLTNRSTTISVDAALDGTQTLPAEPWGHLTIVRSETVGPTTKASHPVVSVTGKGRLVGTCLMAQGHASMLVPPFLVSPINFLEGDEEVTLDGRAFRGTGTEDYFDSAFYFHPEASASPFAQWGGKSDAPGQPGTMTACRWHVLGATIDFQQSLDMAMEIGPPDPATLDHYVSTAFLYRER